MSPLRSGKDLSLLKLIVAPIRRVINFPLFQLVIAIAIILWLQAADTGSVRGKLFGALDWLVQFSVTHCAALFEVRSFTRSWLEVGFMIAYVYLAGLLALMVAGAAVRTAISTLARWNIFWLRNTIARERGIAAYRAWVPFEKIRPPHIAQAQWEEKFAWPASGEPPYPSAARRIAGALAANLFAIVVILILLQAFTPISALTWLSDAVRKAIGY
jgi:hypothetical protein